MRPRHALPIAAGVRIVRPALAPRLRVERDQTRRRRREVERCRRRRAASSRTRWDAARRARSPSRDAGRARRCDRSTRGRGARRCCGRSARAARSASRRRHGRSCATRRRSRHGRGRRVRSRRAVGCTRREGEWRTTRRCRSLDSLRSLGMTRRRCVAGMTRSQLRDDVRASWMPGTPHREPSSRLAARGTRPHLRGPLDHTSAPPIAPCPSSRSTPVPRAPAPWSSPTTAPCSRRCRSRSRSTSPPTAGWSTTPTRSTRRRSRARAKRSPRRSSTPKQIAGIGIAVQRETVVVWNRATGKPIQRAIVWQDRRTADRCRELAEDPNAVELVGRTGLLLDPYFSATKLAWILDHVDGARAAAERGELLAGTIDTWLLWKLTGGKVHATDATNASRTLLFDIYRQQWDEELCILFDVPIVDPAAGARQRRRLRRDDAGRVRRADHGARRSSAISRRARSARTASSRARPRRPTARDASSSCTPATPRASRATGCSAPSRCGSPADVVRARGEHLQRGHRGAVAARPARPDRARARERDRRGEHPVVGRRVLHPRLHRARRAVVGSRRARRADRSHARQRSRAHRARRARVGGVPDARPRERVRRGRCAARGAARGRRHGGERVAHADASPISSASPSSGPSCSRPRRGARRGSPACTPGSIRALGEKGVRRVEQTFTREGASKPESDALHAGWLRAIHRVRS